MYGGGVSRQLDHGVTVSLLGTIHEGIDLGAAPALSADEVAARIEQATGATLVGGRSPSLGILPLPDGSHALAYRAPMSDGRFYFADAADGGLVHAEDAFHSQSAIGTGVGFLGDRKKMAATIAGGRFEARDQLRSGEIVTLDMRGDLERRELLVFDAEPWTSSDIASDDDNEWHVQAVIDGHAHMGWTYDYLTRRHGWNGLDGDNGRIIGLVNNDFNNALAIRPPFGPEETGAYVFGMRGTEPRVALHTVAHELMHGVTYAAGSLRDHVDPWSQNYPGSYRYRYEFALARDDRYWYYSGSVFVDRRFAFSRTSSGYGGQHWNSLILSHAFYLAIESGTNLGTGLSVDGVGSARRAQVEEIFFRALTDLIPTATSFPQTADAIRQSAADLAPGGEAQRAIEDALIAVGLAPATTPLMRRARHHYEQR